MNNLTLASALATAPSTAFTELRERPRFWFPLLVVTLASTVMVYWYYSTVDIEWLKDAMFSNNADMQKMSESERAAAMGMVGRGTLMWGSVVGTLVAVPLFLLLQSLYFLLAAKVTKLSPGFKHWFSLSCWTALPLLIGNVVAAILLTMATSHQISPSSLQPLSVNELLVHAPLGSSSQGLLDSLSIPGFLAWALMIVGVHTWSQRSWLFSAVFVFIPIVLLYGIWALFAFK